MLSFQGSSSEKEIQEGRLKFAGRKMKIDVDPLHQEEALFVEPVEINMVEISEYDEADMLEKTDESPDVDIAEVYPRADEDLVDFLYRCKNKGSQVCLCPRCVDVTDKVAAENFQKLQLGKRKGSGVDRVRQNERIPRKVVENAQARPRSFVPSASAPRGTWIKPQGKLETPQGVATTRGGLAINYRHEFKSEKRTHVSENYLGKNPMSRTQWRRFQRHKQAEREASREMDGKGMSNEADSEKRVAVKVDTAAKERIREYVRRPSEKCSDEITDDFNSESEAGLDILVNVLSILPEEYNCVTEVNDSVDDVDAEEMALHKPRCYFVLNDGAVESQEEIFERPTMTMTSHLKSLLIRAKVEGVTINKVLVDCGATVNIMPHHILKKIGKYDTDVRSNNIVGKTKSTMGVIMVKVTVGSITRPTLFMVIDAKPS